MDAKIKEKEGWFFFLKKKPLDALQGIIPVWKVPEMQITAEYSAYTCSILTCVVNTEI